MPKHTLQWAQEGGKVVEALCGSAYVGSPRYNEIEAGIAELVDGGFLLRQIINHIADIDVSLEEYTSLIYALGVYDGSRNGAGYGRSRR
jgi:hypothetical protein